MRFLVEFEFDNDFYRMAENPEEIDRLAVTMTLQDVVLQVKQGHDEHYIKDENGITVGAWSFTDD